MLSLVNYVPYYTFKVGLQEIEGFFIAGGYISDIMQTT